MPGVLTVSGVDQNGSASFDASSQGITIGVAAPSEQLVGVIPGGQYVTWSGTSGATPIVAGIVALVRASHPDLDAANVINRIVSSARDVGPPGADFTYGFGLVDAAAAVGNDIPVVTENPMGDLAEWIRVNRRAEATPAPSATPLIEADPEVVAGPPNPIGILLPSVTSLQLVGIPTLVLALLAPSSSDWWSGSCARSAGHPGHDRLGSVFPQRGDVHIVRKILIVGGGYAGFYTAKKLEKWLGRREAEVTMVDPLPYMTYQPFLPEVAAGSLDPRHALVTHRRHLKRTKVITAKVTNIDHAEKTATITPEVGEPWDVDYDIVVVTAGAVSRTFPIPGLADQAIGLKNIEEAISIRDRMTDNFAKASNLPAGPERDRLLTLVVVGGGFAGIEIFGELRSFASALVGSTTSSRSMTPTSTSSRRWAASCPRCRSRPVSG